MRRGGRDRGDVLYHFRDDERTNSGPHSGAAAVGASLGFLRWNFNPAKIFMGDGGAMFLGFLMATLGLKMRPASLIPADWLMPVFILGVPIFDTVMVSISRARRGLLPFTSPGKDHTAHRLSNLGLGGRSAVLVMYVAAAVLGAIALVVPSLSATSVYTLAAVLAVAALCAIFLLEGLPYERQVKLHKPHVLLRLLKRSDGDTSGAAAICLARGMFSRWTSGSRSGGSFEYGQTVS